MRGKLITIYGINNVGKSTQARILTQRLNENGVKAVHIKYPVYSVEPSGVFLNKVLRSGADGGQKISERELQMWFVINRHQYEHELNSLLSDGVTVIAEDYIGTGIAWGTAKGLDMAWLINLNKGLVKEDLAILLNGKRRMFAKESGHVHEENDDLVERCKEIHVELGKKYDWNFVDADGEIDEVAARVWKVVDRITL